MKRFIGPVGAQFIVRTADLSARPACGATRADKPAVDTINRVPTGVHDRILSEKFIIGSRGPTGRTGR